MLIGSGNCNAAKARVLYHAAHSREHRIRRIPMRYKDCLLYTSDAADE